MDEQIRQALANVILSQINELSDFDPGSTEQQTAVENVTKLYKLALEDIKTENDYEEKTYRREADAQHEQNELDRQTREEEFKADQLAEQKKDRYFRIGLGVAEIVLPLIFYASWMKRGFKFEETGTYTSKTFMNLFNRFKPTKK